MKKSAAKVLSFTLCGVLALSGIGGTVYAMNASENPAPAESAPVESKLNAAPNSGEQNWKDETVYVLASADGTVEKIIVSDWVRNTQGGDLLNDVTTLTGIEAVKGNPSYTLGGDNACVWNAAGDDVYYQGSIDKELPVSVSVSYTLDGQPICPAPTPGAPTPFPPPIWRAGVAG